MKDNEKVRINRVTDEYIEFTNGDRIILDHEPDCCEYNFADFRQIEENEKNVEFTLPIDFEVVNDYGFRFGNQPLKMFFIPCYSLQNGYYSTDISIYYAKHIANFDCDENINY